MEGHKSFCFSMMRSATPLKVRALRRPSRIEQASHQLRATAPQIAWQQAKRQAPKLEMSHHTMAGEALVTRAPLLQCIMPADVSVNNCQTRQQIGAAIDTYLTVNHGIPGAYRWKYSGALSLPKFAVKPLVQTR